MIEFNGNLIHGTHESPKPTAPELQTARTKFSGVRGESEIRQQQGGRNITIRIKLHNGYTSFESLQAQIKALEDMVGQHGDLRITRGPYGGLNRVYEFCTFEGFTEDPSPDSGPLPDNAGTLDGTTPSWWVDGWLAFRQLSTESS